MPKTFLGAHARAMECVNRNMVDGAAVPVEDVVAWVIGAVVRYLRDQPEPTPKPLSDERPGNIHERGPTALGGPKEVLSVQSKSAGFTGDACSTCGNFTLTRSGTCLRCVTCGSTSGCS